MLSLFHFRLDKLWVCRFEQSAEGVGQVAVKPALRTNPSLVASELDEQRLSAVGAEEFRQHAAASEALGDPTL